MSENYASDHSVEGSGSSGIVVILNDENGGVDGEEHRVVGTERSTESAKVPDLGFSTNGDSTGREDGVFRVGDSVERVDTESNADESNGPLQISVDQESSSLEEGQVGHSSGVLVDVDGSMQDHPNDGNSTGDAGKEDMFVDAPDQLIVYDGRNADVGDLMVVSEAHESLMKKVDIQPEVMDELAQLHAKLDETIAEKELFTVQFKEYKEEREMFARELANIHRQLQVMTNQQSLLVENSDDNLDHLRRAEREDGEDKILVCDTPLLEILNGCSNFTVHLKSALDEKLQSEGTVRELHAILFTKDQEIEDLNKKVTELSVSRDVVISYLASLKETWSEFLREVSDAQLGIDADLEVSSKRLLASLATVVKQDNVLDDSSMKGISLVEKSTMLLIEDYNHLLSEINNLGKCLSEVRSDFTMPQGKEFGAVFDVACKELFEYKGKEMDFLEKLNQLEEENKKLLEQLEKEKERLEETNAETRKTKMELDQAESKLVITKEKLSMAVTKGKALVQQRDSLRQSLAEKTNELEKCLVDLQEKSNALEATKVTDEELMKSQNLVVSLQESLLHRTDELEKSLVELQEKSNALEATKVSDEELTKSQNLVFSLQESLLQRRNVLHEIEEVVSQTDTPEELQSMEIIDSVRWLVNRRNSLEGIFMETRKIKDALSSIDLPESVSSTGLESQINWLGESFAQAREAILKLEGEIINTRVAIESHESELSEARMEIDRLLESLLKEKQEKDSLQMGLEDITCKYEGIVDKLFRVSSEKDGLIRQLLEVSGNTTDNEEVDQSSGDTGTLTEKCIGKIREKINVTSQSSFVESEQFERLQCLLYVKYQELTLFEKMLEEEMVNRSEISNMSNELRSASEQILALKNERDTLQINLERAEEKSSFLREKLSMAVKKGKGLVQEREGFKLSLEEKNAEIEKLKSELEQQVSRVIECKDQIKSLCSDLEHMAKLESDIISMKDQKDQIEQFLQESNNMLQRVIDSIECIVLPNNIGFEEPVEKVKWVADNFHELQVGKVRAEQEMEKAREEAALLASKLGDAHSNIKSLEDALSEMERNISLLSDERKDTQAAMICAQQELEKAKEEADLQASKLADAYATVKSLEDALLQAENNIYVLADEKKEGESRSKEEILTLNTKLMACMEELTGTQGNLETQSAELVSHLNDLQILMKDEGLLSLLTEGFKKKFEDLRNMGRLVQQIREQFTEKGSEGMQIHPGAEKDRHMGKGFSVNEGYSNGTMVNSEMSAADLVHDIPSYLTKIVEGFNMTNRLLSAKFEGFYRSLDEQISVLVQELQTTRDEVIHMLELMETLKHNANNLEAYNRDLESKLSTLQNNTNILLSACVEATQELHIEMNNKMIDPNSDTELEKSNAMEKHQEWVDASKFVEAAGNLLLAARRIRIEFQQFENVKSGWSTTLGDLQNELNERQIAAENAVHDRDLNQSRVSKLEGDLEALQNYCSEMTLQLQEYQAREDMWREKEAELSSLRHTLAAKDQETNGSLLSEHQVETLFNKINEIDIPFKISKVESPKNYLLDPVDKLFYILDNVAELHHRMESFAHDREVLQYDKEELQLSFAAQVREIEHLKKEIKSDLDELTLGLERIIQKLGGNDSFEDKKIITAKGLLPVLEKLVIALIVESESSKSKAQELGVKLTGNQMIVDELSAKVKLLEDSHLDRPTPPESVHERSIIFEPSSLATGSEISEIEDVGMLGKSSIPPVPAAAHVRTMRKGSSDHLALNIDPESDRLINHNETDDKGHIFKSLNTSGLIPKQGKLIADRIDGIWVSGGRILMSRPGARMTLIAYWLVLHIWVLGTIL